MNGEWKGDTAAGCQNYANFDKNPTFGLVWPNNEADNRVLVEVRGPRDFAIGFTWDAVSLTNSSPLNHGRSFSTGNYRCVPLPLPSTLQFYHSLFTLR